MMELFGAVGWGLLACGAASHLVHHARFRELLALHLDRERVPALMLALCEVSLVVAIPIALFANSRWLTLLAAGAALLGLGFVAWIARLLVKGSTLPCACSFSQAPTSGWSLARASGVLLVAGYLFSSTSGGTPAADSTLQVATLFVGLAIASALFVLPEALGWPPASKAVMKRVEAFQDPATS